MDGWMDGYMDERTDGQTNKQSVGRHVKTLGFVSDFSHSFFSLDLFSLSYSLSLLGIID